MKKLKVTKERFENSRYFTRKYGKLAFVSESGKTYKTEKGEIIRFVTEAREYVDDDAIDVESAEEFIIFDDPDIFKKIAEVQMNKGKEVQREIKSGEVKPEEVAQTADQVMQGNGNGNNPNVTVNTGTGAATIAAAGGVMSSAINGASTLANSPWAMGAAGAAGYGAVLNKAAEYGDNLGNNIADWWQDVSGEKEQARREEQKTANLGIQAGKNYKDEISYFNQLLKFSNIETKNGQQHFNITSSFGGGGRGVSDEFYDKDIQAMRYGRMMQAGEPIIKKVSHGQPVYFTKDELVDWFERNRYTMDQAGVVQRRDDWIDPKTGEPWKNVKDAATLTTATAGTWTLFGMSATTVGWIIAGVAAAALVTPYIYDKIKACTKTWMADIIAEVKFTADGKEYRCFYDLDENKWVLTYANVKWTSYMDNELDKQTQNEFFNSNFFHNFLNKCKQTFALLFSTSKNEVVFKTLPEIKDAPEELKDILEKIYDNKGAITKHLFKGDH